jgi:hypothetical protein
VKTQNAMAEASRQIQAFQHKIRQARAVMDDQTDWMMKQLILYKTEITESRIRLLDYTGWLKQQNTECKVEENMGKLLLKHISPGRE